MLQDFWFSLGTVAPLLAVMVVGYGARRFGILDGQGV